MTEPPEALSPNLRELILRCLDGSATEHERVALDELVERDEGVARELARAAAFESALELAARERGDELFDRATPSSARRRIIPLVAIGAVLATCGVAAAFARIRSAARTSGKPVASAALSAFASSNLEASTPASEQARGPAQTAAVDRSDSQQKIVVSAPSSSVRSPPPNGRPASVADALQAANELRRQARWADAARAYSRIATDYRATAQGSVAALAAAALHLEHLHDARGALRLYQAALAARGVAAEAQLGIADCYHVLGDRDAEVSALDRYVSDYPAALSRERAARRLSALQGASR